MFLNGWRMLKNNFPILGTLYIQVCTLSIHLYVQHWVRVRSFLGTFFKTRHFSIFHFRFIFFIIKLFISMLVSAMINFISIINRLKLKDFQSCTSVRWIWAKNCHMGWRVSFLFMSWRFFSSRLPDIFATSLVEKMPGRKIWRGARGHHDPSMTPIS